MRVVSMVEKTGATTVASKADAKAGEKAEKMVA